MKAAVRLKYGLPKLLSIKEVAIPVPKHNEVLVRVYATTVSRTDCHVLSGLPFFMRLFTGLLKPRLSITGTDFAGQIEATGKNVTTFKTSDKVMGFEFFGLRSHANYLVLPENKDLITMPENQSYEQAAASIEGAFYACSVFKKMNPKAGQKALVNGATGAIGSAMVQFFKFSGTSVTAVCSNEYSALVKSLGADKIIDYKTDDFTKDKEQYDFVFDAVGKSSFSKCKKILNSNGFYNSSGGPNFLQLLMAPFSAGKKEIFAPPKNFKACLAFIKTLIENGNFQPVIDRKYPIEDIAAAFEYVAAGQKIGNVIITMDN
ncbi:NAD(P)-dependent alcohol dehydrogenase [Ferruginibacter sp.]